MAVVGSGTLGMALTILEALPGLLEAGSQAEQLVMGGAAQIRQMELQGRAPTQAEWDAINTQIASLNSELSAPETDEDAEAAAKNPAIGVVGEDGQQLRASDAFEDHTDGMGADGLIHTSGGTVQTAAVPTDAEGNAPEHVDTAAPVPAPADAPVVTTATQGGADLGTGAVNPVNARVTSDIPGLTTSADTMQMGAQAAQAKETALGGALPAPVSETTTTGSPSRDSAGVEAERAGAYEGADVAQGSTGLGTSPATPFGQSEATPVNATHTADTIPATAPNPPTVDDDETALDRG